MWWHLYGNCHPACRFWYYTECAFFFIQGCLALKDKAWKMYGFYIDPLISSFWKAEIFYAQKNAQTWSSLDTQSFSWYVCAGNLKECLLLMLSSFEKSVLSWASGLNHEYARLVFPLRPVFPCRANGWYVVVRAAPWDHTLGYFLICSKELFPLKSVVALSIDHRGLLRTYPLQTAPKRG